MTVLEVLEQAKALDLGERKELVKLIVDTFDQPPLPAEHEHWGKSLNQLLNSSEPIDLRYPEIKDPVQWVNQIRADERRHRVGTWGEEDSENNDS